MEVCLLHLHHPISTCSQLLLTWVVLVELEELGVRAVAVVVVVVVVVECQQKEPSIRVELHSSLQSSLIHLQDSHVALFVPMFVVH
jgi:hypothetical protein